jgi:hypothetical protein
MVVISVLGMLGYHRLGLRIVWKRFEAHKRAETPA